MVIDVTIGNDRLMLTAYNPRNAVTMLKCVFLLEKISKAMGDVGEDEFMAWLEKQAPAMCRKLREGWQPGINLALTVDPRNAKQEAQIVAHLIAETRGQKGRDIAGQVVVKNKEAMDAGA